MKPVILLMGLCLATSSFAEILQLDGVINSGVYTFDESDGVGRGELLFESYELKSDKSPDEAASTVEMLYADSVFHLNFPEDQLSIPLPDSKNSFSHVQSFALEDFLVSYTPQTLKGELKKLQLRGKDSVTDFDSLKLNCERDPEGKLPLYATCFYRGSFLPAEQYAETWGFHFGYQLADNEYRASLRLNKFESGKNNFDLDIKRGKVEGPRSGFEMGRVRFRCLKGEADPDNAWKGVVNSCMNLGNGSIQKFKSQGSQSSAEFDLAAINFSKNYFNGNTPELKIVQNGTRQSFKDLWGRCKKDSDIGTFSGEKVIRNCLSEGSFSLKKIASDAQSGQVNLATVRDYSLYFKQETFKFGFIWTPFFFDLTADIRGLVDYKPSEGEMVLTIQSGTIGGFPATTIMMSILSSVLTSDRIKVQGNKITLYI